MAENSTIYTVVQHARVDGSDRSYKPLDGEIVIADKSNRRVIKVGDGETVVNNLKDICGTEVIKLQAVPADLSIYNPGTIILVIPDSNNMAERTAYTVYENANGIKFLEAFIGNYSAENIILRDDITLAGDYVAVGNIQKASPEATETLAAAGKSLKEFLTEMFTKRLQPEITEDPSITLSLFKSGSKVTKDITIEVGSKLNLQYAAELNPGSYTYGPNTGVTAQSWSVSLSGTEWTGSDAEGLIEEFRAAANTSYQFTVTAQYTGGAQAKDNLGDLSNPALAIEADSISTSSAKITSYREGCFYGAVSTETELTSSNIRDLSYKLDAKWSNNTSKTFTVPAGSTSIILATPCDGTKGISNILNTTVNANMNSAFDLSNPSVIAVAGADGDATSEFAANYNVWVYTPAEPYTQPATLQITLGNIPGSEVN